MRPKSKTFPTVPGNLLIETLFKSMAVFYISLPLHSSMPFYLKGIGQWQTSGFKWWSIYQINYKSSWKHTACFESITLNTTLSDVRLTCRHTPWYGWRFMPSSPFNRASHWVACFKCWRTCDVGFFFLTGMS